MKEKNDIKLGQVWRRKDGRNVKLIDQRVSLGQTEYLLFPQDSRGRQSWKSARKIISQLKLISD